MKRRSILTHDFSRLKQSAALCALVALMPDTALAASNIATAGTTYLVSNLGNSVNPVFQGGTLQIDTAGQTYSQAFTLDTSTTNTIDQTSHAVTFSGVFSNAVSTSAGNIIIANSGAGGSVTLTGISTYTGSTTINSGATLALSGTGSISTSSGVNDGGTFDISQTTSGASIISLGGAGSVTLGNQNLTVTASAGTFTGVISGTGSLILSGGTQILGGANTYSGGTTVSGGTLIVGDGATSGSITGNVVDGGTLSFNRLDAVSFGGLISGAGAVAQTGGGTLTLTTAQTYTGVTTISAGTLALGPGGSVASSSSVGAGGTFDISATSGASIKSLTGSGAVTLGSQTLTFTNASGTFSGVISGSGGIVLTAGTQTLTGLNTYTGATTVNGGTLRLGATSVSNNISDSGTVSFYSGAAVAMTGIISGNGTVSQTGSGVTTISAAQAYTGATTITAGTLALSGSGSLLTSSDVTDNATLDISGTTGGGTSLVTLDGGGGVTLGSQTLTLVNASGNFAGVIAGTGGFTLAGGNETLSGINTYTGVTTITSGTLFLGNSSSLSTSARVVDNAALDISGVTNAGGAVTTAIQSLSGTGSVVLGSKVLILTNAGDTFSGVISGTGGVTVSGGTETLAGANTYTGTTTVGTGGILALSGTGSLAASGSLADSGTFDISAATAPVSFASLSGSGTVNLGTRNLTLSNAVDNFSGIITGSGQLAVTGGTQILSGANTYTGGTVIGAGTLQLGNAGSSGSIAGNVTDNGVLAFNRIDTSTFSGVISGTGSVSQLGGGTTILTAANSYTGGTSITAGTLQIGNGGTSGVITGAVADSGTLAFDRADAVTYAGVISGSGGVSQIGTGSLTLTAANTYTGTTLVAAGDILVLTGTGAIASSAHVTDNGTLDLSTVTAPPRLASLGGSGAVTLGTQNLTITNGADTFSGILSGTGGVTVTGGTQTVNGSFANSGGVAVASGGTLAGNGTTTAVSVASGGTLAPGSAGSGTLKINGNLSLPSGSTLLINMSSAAAPSVSTTGSASLGGTLSVASTDGTYRLGQKLTVLTAASGISGTFSLAQIQSGGAQYKPSVSYDANDVYLEIDLAKLSPLLPTTASVNQARAVGGIDRAIAAGDTLPVAIQNLGTLSSAVLATDASQLSGEIGADIPEASSALVHPFMDAIFDHLQTSKGRSFWASGLAGNALVSGDTTIGSQKLKGRVAGVAGGVDWLMSPGFDLGVAVSAASNSFHLANGMGDGKADAFQAGVYGRMRLSHLLYGNFAGILGLDNVTTNRTLTVSGTDQLTAKFKPLLVGGRYETGLHGGWLSPYAAVEDVFTRMPSYAETAGSGAASYALSYAARNANSAGIELGARQSTATPMGRVWTLELSDRLAWSHALAVAWSAGTRFTSLADSGFTVYGARPGRDAALISLGGTLRNRNGLGLDLHLDSSISARSQTYTGMAGLNFTW